MKKKKKNCWEFKGCGRDLGGKNSKELGVCPAAIYRRLDGVYGGKNAGRICWAVAGTMCAVRVQGTFAQEYKDCIECDFYKSVKEEESHYFGMTTNLEEALLESENRYRMLFECVGDAIFILEAEGEKAGQIVAANRVAAEMHGYTVDELLALNIIDLDAPDAAKEAPSRLQLLLKGDWIKAEIRHRKRDDSIFPIEISAGLIEIGNHKYILALDRDITERKRAEETLRDSEERFRLIAETSGDIIFQTDTQSRITYCSPSVNRYGYSNEKIAGTLFTEYVHPDELLKTTDFFHCALSGDGITLLETRLLQADGTPVYAEINVTPMVRNGTVAGVQGIARDLTERKKMEEAIKHQACHDALTDLPNRALFMDRLERQLAQADRNQKKMAVMFLDLDRFKNINDALGHSVGDLLLYAVAVRLGTCIRGTDTVARIGGDEFNILLSDVNHSEDAAKIAQKIISVFKEPFKIDKYDLHITTSVGISLYPEDGKDSETLLKHADIAMYHAKGSGRNTYQFYNHSINIRSLERMEMENSLRRALVRGELKLYYQPLIEIASGKLICAEALLRWEHPEFGLLKPAEFIQLAEESGIIIPIGEWALHTACEQNIQWQKAGHEPICVAVNISARQFHVTNLLEMASQVLNETGLHPQWLELEITENTLMLDVEDAISKLVKLNEKGIKLSLDDFGTGYSSLNYLKRLPIQTIKVDRSFVREVVNDPNDMAIVTAVIAMTKSLNLQVVAEGVETKEQLAFLRSKGCDEVQGYLYSEPVPAAEFEKLMV